MSNYSSLSLPELNDRIAILRGNIRLLTEQAAASIKFKIPATAKAGRFSLMILTTGKEPKYIEQPVKVTVE